ncbi:MAG: 50S ribosomal protein L2 [Parcubacteria group bacterium]|nr:50S ribosomal protein L2 [Parcubacteria group bacterium]
MSTIDYRFLSKERPYKALMQNKRRIDGRDNKGRVSVRHRGGGHKRMLRIIDFNQDKFDISARVETIEYDPNRTCFIARVLYADGERRYILMPDGLNVGDKIVSSEKYLEPKIGNRYPLKHIPLGSLVYNIELQPKRGGKLVRSAGQKAVLMGIANGYAEIKLPSGEIRRFNENCFASYGSLSKGEWNLVRFGKAGRSRHRGQRPEVRGKVMNPVDHPHGGGEAKNSIGLRYPKTPWGKHALGVKTRKTKKWSNKFIVKRRK